MQKKRSGCSERKTEHEQKSLKNGSFLLCVFLNKIGKKYVFVEKCALSVYTFNHGEKFGVFRAQKQAGGENMMTVSVCIGSACHLKGSYQVIQGMQKLIKEKGLEDQVELKAVFCMGHCTEAVSVAIDEQIYSVSGTTVEDFFNEHVLPAL